MLVITAMEEVIVGQKYKENQGIGAGEAPPRPRPAER